MIMHDCTMIRERLVDLVFDELASEDRRLTLNEVESCPDCLSQYRSMIETLLIFDRATESAMPTESYWPGYEARLSERLRHEGPTLRQRLKGWIGALQPLTTRPLQLATGLAMLSLAIGWWGWRQMRTVEPSPNVFTINNPTPTPQPKIEIRETPDKVIVTTTQPGAKSNNRKPDKTRSMKPNGATPPVRREERSVDVVENNVVSRGYDQPLIYATLFTPETIKHFEKAQLMLRSFRNVGAEKVSRNQPLVDIDYEKQFSRRLLYQNILLRRDAEFKGDLPAEEALSKLEPFLLDIANLPDKPSENELRGIRERLQKKEMIASLQISSSPHATATFQNP